MRTRPILATIAAACVAFLTVCAWDSAQPPVRAAVSPAADHIIVEKSVRRMTLLKDGRVVRTYRVALGRGGAGAKQKSGDNKVPEGVYRITGRNPKSAYHLSLRIGYPTPLQVLEARRRGIDPGGDIMIHGIRNGFGWLGKQHRLADWTQGCIAVTDEEIEEIWRLVPDGTRIEIRS
jgi:murein L,D-transpeptidase YafK